ncbi:heparan sulfate glucosamine 3-O-sulfotransferase 1 [Cephus cinctus]|uniref:Heparan sulfate glucosamine 3-O-sulfotransferase 5 n=1 Tax=Cephus cinctus TaxID=211228 RepID=A0AAJ7RNJ7_CEPCN|nr:heparan sulfate glucosamine 3-O-sulfotransferase 1 [Cephus cinctus]XP_015602351.1 heparan sulfate glucosamine 3-O-sulfotransferase 1 [Cephus cinctus]XP_015602352.1 heparan sulfate glucosamine 3-O-sulfotransferase 1 [Cephus cinctus]XP_015602353.1 heparan sulfate glucosamine 3-O-sulfotransferase 1 [Cephus cinctus]XP_015602354.1 heparan sulfate glucosamine 3-O-sulfotransferase 1 [Cephus cinctus]XP_015602355.1 heparan sulfate glucosamine 3-O-sulfotransferase 1 [Cephus cinctus]XP_015602356.1 he
MPSKARPRREWSPQSPIDVLWMPRSAMRPAEGDTSDCILVVGISRPKMAAAFLSVALVSLFLTFHVLYDSAVYSLHAASGVEARTVELVSRVRATPPLLFSNKVHFPRTSRHLPQAIIIGVRKCGTRALLEMLFLHPQIQKAAGEVHFFDRDDNYSKGLEWYRRKMPYSFKGQITIEKSPSYFVTPEVPERIRAMNSSVKLLLIVREPVTRTISDYTQLRTHAATASSASASLATPRSTVPGRSFEELVMRTDGSINESYRPVAISLYHTYMHRWLEVFNRNQILVVNGDQLIEDPVPQLRRIESFLGLEPRIGRHNFYFNHTKGFYCLRNDTTDKCLRESKGRRHPRVSPVVVTKLRRFFNEHNQRFYELVGEDLGWPEE